jgi:hypothetical protein
MTSSFDYLTQAAHSTSVGMILLKLLMPAR